MIFTPKRLLYATLILTYIGILLQIKPQDPAVFSLYIVSILLIVFRLRFNVDTKWIFLDIAIYLGLYSVTDTAIYVILPSFMLLIYYGKYWVIFIYGLLMIGAGMIGFDGAILSAYAMLSTLILHFFDCHAREALETIDTLKEKHYTLEQEKYTLLSEQDHIARMSMLDERDRIAVALHDNLGHELTAALLSSRAFETTKPDALENTSYLALKSRLENAVESLKSTVHNTKPLEPYGLEQFTAMIENFTYTNVKLDIPKDVSSISAKHWVLLISILKEALTNIQKHAQPTLVEISLVITPPLIKFTIKNDGINDRSSTHGVGLRFMRKRLEQFGGTLTIQKSFTFTLICTIPLD
ncbi:MAG: sensor histidine kinase [Bacillota bacterium]